MPSADREHVIAFVVSTSHRAAAPVVEGHRGVEAGATGPPRPPEQGGSAAGTLGSVLAAWSAAVETIRPDAAWCDLTGRVRSADAGRATALLLQSQLRRETGRPWAVGIGSNKLLARVAAEIAGPAGIGQLRRSDVPVRLWPLAVAALPGTDADLCRRLEGWRVRTVGDLALLGPARCQRRLGRRAGLALWRAAHGRDDSPVSPSSAGSALNPLPLAPALRAPPPHRRRVG